MGVVYYIKCKGNGLVYVGSTIRKPNQRFLEHLHYLRNGNHHSKFLQRAYNKYGEDSLENIIVEEVEDNNFLLAREQFHIWRFDTTMNGAPVSDSIYAAHAANRGRVMPKDERERRSKAVKAGYKNYDFSDRSTEERRAALRTGWLKRKANKPLDPRIDEWIKLYKEGKSIRKIECVSDACRHTIRARLIEAGVFDRDRKYPRNEEWKKNAVEGRTKWISDEIGEWVKLYKDGVSIRGIERITGRTRKMIAREFRKIGLIK